MSKSRVTPFTKQCFVTASVCSNIISTGCMIGLPAILLPQLQGPGSAIPIDKDQASWIASSASLALIGQYITPPIMSKYGRRMAHFSCTITAMISWFIIILATNFTSLIIGRILQGVSFGMLLSLRSVLLGEYTSPRNRGAFLTTVSLSQAFGIFFVHLVGSFVSWQKTSLICVFFAFASLLMTIYSPESPSWLAEQGRYDECRKVFRWLRGNEEDEELEDLIESRILFEKHKIGTTTNNNRLKNMLDTIKKNEFYKPITLMIHANFMMQFAGGSTIAAYSTVILGLLMGPEVNVHFWMIFLDTQRIISNTVAVFVINKVKRRTMMFSTGALCVASHLAIAAYTYSKKQGILPYDALWIPALLINLQFFSVATGMVPIPGVISGEVFPLEYRGSGNSISLFSGSAGLFLVLKTFPSMIESLGLHGTYIIYSFSLIYCLSVMWFLLPETMGRTLQQIEDEFRGRPLTYEEREVRISLQVDPVESYKRKVSMRRCSSTLFS